jgi:acetyltransferase-like isoleucine patch superfamily enzyme
MMKPAGIIGLISSLLELVVFNLPGEPGYRLRRVYWKKRLGHLGKNVRIEPGAYFQGARHIRIDDGCWIDRGVIILAGPDRSERPRRRLENPDFPLGVGEVYIGKGVHVAPHAIISGIGGAYISEGCVITAGCKLYSFSHHFRSDEDMADRGISFSRWSSDDSRQFMLEGPIFLDRNVGLAVNTTVLPGVSIRRDSFVLPHSVVKDSFDENSLISGNPAVRVGERFRAGGGG